jgi:hypothetical protein
VECQLVVVAVQTHWQVETLFVADSLTKLIEMIGLYCCYCEFQVVLFACKSSKETKRPLLMKLASQSTKQLNNNKIHLNIQRINH